MINSFQKIELVTFVDNSHYLGTLGIQQRPLVTSLQKIMLVKLYYPNQCLLIQ